MELSSCRATLTPSLSSFNRRKLVNGREKLTSSILSLSHTHSQFLYFLSFFFFLLFLLFSLFLFFFLFSFSFCFLSSTPPTNWSSKTKNGFDFKQVRKLLLTFHYSFLFLFFSKIFWQNIFISLLSSLSLHLPCVFLIQSHVAAT